MESGPGADVSCVPSPRPAGYREAGSHFPDLIWLPLSGSLPDCIKHESWLSISWNLTVVKFQQTGGDFQLNLWKLLNSDPAYDNLSAVFFCTSWNIVSIKQLLCLRHCNIILYLWGTLNCICIVSCSFKVLQRSKFLMWHLQGVLWMSFNGEPGIPCGLNQIPLLMNRSWSRAPGRPFLSALSWVCTLLQWENSLVGNHLSALSPGFQMGLWDYGSTSPGPNAVESRKWGLVWVFWTSFPGVWCRHLVKTTGLIQLFLLLQMKKGSLE